MAIYSHTSKQVIILIWQKNIELPTQKIAFAQTSLFHATMNITLVKPDDPGADIRALATTFSQKMLNHGKHSDICNFVVLNTSYLAAGLFLLAFLWIAICVKVYYDAHSHRFCAYFRRVTNGVWPNSSPYGHRTRHAHV
jgi:hypothetical protein